MLMKLEYLSYLALLLLIVVGNAAGQRDGYRSRTIYALPKSWKVVRSPASTRSSTSGLSAVAAISASRLWAVGYTYLDDPGSTQQGAQALIEQWNGSAWRAISSPVLPQASYVSLNCIAALSGRDIWAAGGSYAIDYSTTQQLIEHWNGQSWQIIAPPVVQGASYSNLFGIAALSSNNIWAVGGYARPADHGMHHALIEQWNGKRWSVIPAPGRANLPGSLYEELQGVVALSARDIWAVGVSLTSGYAHRSLIEHWDGRTWRIVPSNDQLASSRSNRTLNAVAARASNDVWAVGVGDDRGPSQSLIKHWNGKTWSDVPGPGSTATRRVADGGTLLDLIICAAHDIWAVGSSGNETRAEHWNGQAWSIAATPTLNNGTSILSGITHVATAHQLWAVGTTNGQGLIETRSDT